MPFSKWKILAKWWYVWCNVNNMQGAINWAPNGIIGGSAAFQTGAVPGKWMRYVIYMVAWQTCHGIAQQTCLLARHMIALCKLSGVQRVLGSD